jgi:hypothetical protein
MLAIDDALRESTYDAIVLAIRERPHRRRTNVAARARQTFDLPVVDVLGTPPVLAGRPESTSIMRQTA